MRGNVAICLCNNVDINVDAYVITRVGARASHSSKIKALVELLDISCAHNPLMHVHARTLLESDLVSKHRMQGRCEWISGLSHP